MSHVFGLERHIPNNEFVHRRRKTIRKVLAEARRQRRHGVANVEEEVKKLASISEKYSTWAQQQATMSAFALHLNQENGGVSDYFIRLFLL